MVQRLFCGTALEATIRRTVQWSGQCTHNRFHVVQGMTPLERVSSGSIYRGKVAVFGECVLAYMKVQNKGNPSWVKSIWLGKVATSDMHLVSTAGAGFHGGGLVLTRSIRRLTTEQKWDAGLATTLRGMLWDYPGYLGGHLGFGR